jgi:hypothetical protein
MFIKAFLRKSSRGVQEHLPDAKWEITLRWILKRVTRQVTYKYTFLLYSGIRQAY